MKLKYTLTKDLMLEHLSVDESYRAKMGVSVTIVDTFDYYYFPNQEIKIPTLEENVDYSAGGTIK